MKTKSRWILDLVLPLIAGLTVLLFSLLPYQSQWVEDYYSRGFFPIYRSIWDNLVSWSPIPLIYLLFLVIVYVLFKGIVKSVRLQDRWYKKIGSVLLTIVKIGSLLIILFYWCWGFNYKRVSPLQNLISVDTLPDENELFRELEHVTFRLEDIRSTLPDSIDWQEATAGRESEYREALTQVFSDLGLGHTGRVRARLIHPKGSLLHFSTAGVYLPFIGEGHIDPGLHPITWPSTMTHEMSHGYGYTSEDLCNFWALLACVNSQDPVVQYSGYFSYWRYLRSNAYLANRDRYMEFAQCVPPIVMNDLREVMSYSDRYVEILPQLRDLFYDSYLKSHGISDGLKNYSRIIVLAYQWQTEYGTLYLGQATK